MKRIKLGFTLAEVLITLSIIGVVAAIVMPSVMTNYTYKTVGVKLAKFYSQLESATRPYVVQGEAFTGSTLDAANFVNDSFIITNKNDFETQTVTCKSSYGNTAEDIAAQAVCGTQTSGTIITYNYVHNSDSVEAQAAPNGARLGSDKVAVELKDGTRFQIYLIEDYSKKINLTGYEDEVDVNQVGIPVFGVAVDPEVAGLPKAVNTAYKFVVTELGYVYPDRSDECLSAIFDAKFNTNTKTFGKDSACVATVSAGGGAGGAGGGGGAGGQ